MNHAARRIGRSLALVLPVVLVLSGTLAVTSVPWATTPADSKAVNASSQTASKQAKTRAPHEVLRDRLLAELEAKNPGAALTSLQKEMTRKPSLARHCTSLAKSLGRAAVKKYGAAYRAHQYSRPVCDTSFAYGIAQMS